MSNKWIIETTKFDVIYFVWDNGKEILNLHDKQLVEAMKIAKEFGYRPRSFFRPSTWGNVCVGRAEQVSVCGPGEFTYVVPVAQQKQILKSIG